jgi:protein-S-isoprenylcysteine O-methyltransferase Ste14
MKTADQANSVKPKHEKHKFSQKMKDYILFLLWTLLEIQLLGLSLFPFPYNMAVQCFGFVMSVTGVVVSVMGRRELGVNWAHGGEYQVKNSQELVTTGIYRSIRHPIYLGVMLAYVGGQIVAGSYLSILFLILFAYSSIVQAKKEEKLLLHYFGKQYEDYMQNTKMLIFITRIFPGGALSINAHHQQRKQKKRKKRTRKENWFHSPKSPRTSTCR